ncbi:hypothetical protein HWC16_gp021 [Salmonella phage Sepoy]|uniref:Uncharacterized protein n=1 Tax=Salmonella phage Sepoy TaxID=2565517 RepID=A0A4V1F105_9CAUD|nr:hypothetical protein HWC16_gp021 [Salmonella phage Sepoy]QCQ65515.1 hypothetical protein Sepoy_021 [Salmonella phage Sepoy]
MCDCVSLRRSANPMRFWGMLGWVQRWWCFSTDLRRFWG